MRIGHRSGVSIAERRGLGRSLFRRSAKVKIDLRGDMLTCAMFLITLVGVDVRSNVLNSRLFPRSTKHDCMLPCRTRKKGCVNVYLTFHGRTMSLLLSLVPHHCLISPSLSNTLPCICLRENLLVTHVVKWRVRVYMPRVRLVLRDWINCVARHSKISKMAFVSGRELAFGPQRTQ